MLSVLSEIGFDELKYIFGAASLWVAAQFGTWKERRKANRDDKALAVELEIKQEQSDEAITQGTFQRQAALIERLERALARADERNEKAEEALANNRVAMDEMSRSNREMQARVEQLEREMADVKRLLATERAANAARILELEQALEQMECLLIEERRRVADLQKLLDGDTK